MLEGAQQKQPLILSIQGCVINQPVILYTIIIDFNLLNVNRVRKYN